MSNLNIGGVQAGGNIDIGGVQFTDTKIYTRGDEVSLPSDDTNLEVSFTTQEYTDVATEDGTRVSQSSANDNSIFLFKNKHTSQDTITLNINTRSNIAPSSSPVYLQIYNRNSTTWETLASNSTTAANTDFDLQGIKIDSLSDYFDANFWVSWRVYQ